MSAGEKPRLEKQRALREWPEIAVLMPAARDSFGDWNGALAVVHIRPCLSSTSYTNTQIGIGLWKVGNCTRRSLHATSVFDNNLENGSLNVD
jgi:hypothetical protein